MVAPQQYLKTPAALALSMAIVITLHIASVATEAVSNAHQRAPADWQGAARGEWTVQESPTIVQASAPTTAGAEPTTEQHSDRDVGDAFANAPGSQGGARRLRRTSAGSKHGGEYLPVRNNAQASVRSHRSCGTTVARAQCIANTWPVFDEYKDPSCTTWVGRQATPRHDLGFNCQLEETSKPMMFQFFDGAHIFLLGDSTFRRAGAHWYSLAMGLPFEDDRSRNRGHADYHRVMSSTALPSGHGLRESSHPANIWLSTMWMPQLLAPQKQKGQSKKHLHAQLKAMSFDGIQIPKPNNNGTSAPNRKVFVLGQSAWEPSQWRSSPHGVDEWIDEMVAAVDVLSNHREFNGKRDLVLVRLPIPPVCKSNCSADHPNNKMLSDVHDRLQAAMQERHPSVAAIPMTPWTLGAQKVGRLPCFPSDEKTIHFGTDPPRLAFVQQLMYAIRVMAADLPAWRSSLSCGVGAPSTFVLSQS